MPILQYELTSVRGTPMTKDITDETEKDHPAWTRVKQMHDRGDFDKIDRMVKVWDGLESLGTIGNWLGKILTWFAAFLAAYLALTGHLADWIRSIR